MNRRHPDSSRNSSDLASRPIKCTLHHFPDRDDWVTNTQRLMATQTERKKNKTHMEKDSKVHAIHKANRSFRQSVNPPTGSHDDYIVGFSFQARQKS